MFDLLNDIAKFCGTMSEITSLVTRTTSSSESNNRNRITETQYDTAAFEREMRAVRQAARAGKPRPFNFDNIRVTASTKPEHIANIVNRDITTITTSSTNTAVRNRPWYEPVAYWARRIVNPTVTNYTGSNPDLDTAFKGYRFIANPDRIILRIKFSNTKKHKNVTTELEFCSLADLRSEFANALKKDLSKVFTDAECQAFMESFNNAVASIRAKSRHQHQFLQFI